MPAARVLLGRFRVLTALLVLGGCGRVGIELNPLDTASDTGVAQDGGPPSSMDVLDSGGLDAAVVDAARCDPRGPAGLAAHWPFDETVGNFARDILQMRVAPLLNFVGNAWTKGQVNGALAFDGVDDVVDLGAASAPLYAVSFWLKPDALGLVTQTSWLSPRSSVGGDWDAPENAYRLDLQRSQPRPINGSSQQWTGFGLQLPGGTPIVGLEAQVAIDNINPTATLAIELSFDGGQSFTSTGREAGLPDFDRYKAFGSATDLWGRAWTAEELSDASLQVRLTKAGVPLLPLTPGVDHVRIRVHHGGLLVPRPLLALTPTARIELTGSSVTTTGLPAGTTVYVDGVSASTVDTAWHHVVVTMPTPIQAADVRFGGTPGVPYSFGGLLDELKLFGAPLTTPDLSVLRTGLCP